MTRVQSWTIGLVSVIALIAAALIASGAGSLAQEGSPTPGEAPAATATPEATDGADATPEATDDADEPDDGDDSNRGNGSGEGRSDEDCPEKEEGASGTSGDDSEA
jgi:hypothetical protein